MARVRLSNRTLLIDAEEDGVAVSIKPTKDKRRLWGNAGGFYYSFRRSDVDSVIIVRSSKDKVWVNKAVDLPIEMLDRASERLPGPHGGFRQALKKLASLVIP